MALISDASPHSNECTAPLNPISGSAEAMRTLVASGEQIGRGMYLTLQMSAAPLKLTMFAGYHCTVSWLSVDISALRGGAALQLKDRLRLVTVVVNPSPHSNEVR